jgi:hypothetical protein
MTDSRSPHAGTGGPVWRKSSYSGNNGGQCVEMAPHDNGSGSLCLIRDSKDRSGPTLAFAPDAWQAFVAAVKDGKFDLI